MDANPPFSSVVFSVNILAFGRAYFARPRTPPGRGRYSHRSNSTTVVTVVACNLAGKCSERENGPIRVALAHFQIGLSGVDVSVLHHRSGQVYVVITQPVDVRAEGLSQRVGAEFAARGAVEAGCREHPLDDSVSLPAREAPVPPADVKRSDALDSVPAKDQLSKDSGRRRIGDHAPCRHTAAMDAAAAFQLCRRYPNPRPNHAVFPHVLDVQGQQLRNPKPSVHHEDD